MATIVKSIGLKGMEGYLVQVEVTMMPGVESVSIVGLPDVSVKESKDRVMGAVYANDCQIPDKKIIINLSPSEEKKNSPLFDLAMAIGVMKEAGEIKYPVPDNTAFLGVLSLDGSIKSVNGMLPAIIAARKENIKILYLLSIADGIYQLCGYFYQSLRTNLPLFADLFTSEEEDMNQINL